MLRDVRFIKGFKLDSHHKSLLFCMESRGEKIYPSYKKLAADAGCSPRTAQRKVLDLKNQGIIRVETRVKDKKYTSNLYSLNKELIKEEYESYQSQDEDYPV